MSSVDSCLIGTSSEVANNVYKILIRPKVCYRVDTFRSDLEYDYDYDYDFFSTTKFVIGVRKIVELSIKISCRSPFYYENCG